MITNIVAPNAPTVESHPGTPGFNAQTCPQCASRCGDLIYGRCLACHLGWNEPLGEAVVDATCPCCDYDYPVLIAQIAGGAWVRPHDERCPACAADANGDHPRLEEFNLVRLA